MSKNANIKITADSSSAKKGVDSVTEKLNNLSKKAKSSLSSFSKLGMAATGVGAAFSIVKEAVGTVSEAINECVDAYKVQRNAEVQLETAAKNNPYMNSTSVQNLKNFASEMQSIGTVGDEVLIPMMAELAASGRTEAEIQDIISTSLDVSASGAMSLESAVKNLNKTYNGTAGELGETNAAIKSLTTEQLKNGEAVQVMKKQYAGMMEMTTKATGAGTQLSNAWGDFKEIVGNGFQSALTPVEGFLTKLITKINDFVGGTDSVKGSLADLKDYVSKGSADKHTTTENEAAVANANTQLVAIEKQIEKVRKEYEKAQKAAKDWLDENDLTVASLEGLSKSYFNDNFQGRLNAANEKLNKLLQQKEQLEDVKEEAQNAADLARAAEREAEAKATTAKKAQEEVDARDKLRQQYDETIRNAEEEIKLRKQLGEDISKQEEAQTLMNTATQAYISMMKDPAFKGNSGSYIHEVNARQYIADKAKIAAGVTATTGEEVSIKVKPMFDKAGADEWIKELENSLKSDADLLKDSLTVFDEEYNYIVNNFEFTEEQKLKLAEEYGEKRKQLELDIATAQIQTAEKVISKLSTGFSNIYSTLSEFSELAQTQATNEATVKEAALEKEYSDGLISLEEYNDKKSKLDKEAAQKTYKLQMWAWSAQLLSIGASTAQAIAKVLADSTISSAASIALTATVGALGAAQLATAIANKPIPPSSYATGGIVGGTSYSGDKVQANVNSGEMILNAQQQRQLWQMANGNGASGLNVEVKNYMGDSANVSTSFDEGKLTIMVNKIVKSSMQNGEYTNALTAAQNLQNGTNYQS